MHSGIVELNAGQEKFIRLETDGSQDVIMVYSSATLDLGWRDQDILTAGLTITFGLGLRYTATPLLRPYPADTLSLKAGGVACKVWIGFYPYCPCGPDHRS